MPSTRMSDEGRSELRIIGFPYTVEIRRCTKCNKHSSEIPADKAHPMDERIIEARRALEQHRGNVKLSQHVHRLQSQRHHLSRCCAARYRKLKEDHMQPLWEMWQERHERLAERGLTAEQVRWDMVRDDDGWVDDEKLARSQREYDEDFVILNFMTGWSDGQIRRFCKIMRQEEERQRCFAESPQPQAPVEQNAAFVGSSLTGNQVSLPLQTAPLR